jgi:ribosomal protein S18 acetylase RimI-like enzyme
MRRKRKAEGDKEANDARCHVRGVSPFDLVGKMSTVPDSSPTVSIRIAKATDVPAIVSVVNAAYAIETFFQGTRTDAKGVMEMMQKGEFLVAESASGGIVATVYTELRGERGYFGMLAVEPSQQGSGLGRKMMEAAEGHCRSHGCKHMDIDVVSLCPDNLSLYRKFGYFETGTEQFHPPRSREVGVECHLIIMSKAL